MDTTRQTHARLSDAVSVTHPTNRPNFTILDTPDYRVAFSYVTPIGFNRLDGAGWILRRNNWSTTTGKHLNYLDANHATRLDDNAWFVLYGAAIGVSVQ